MTKSLLKEWFARLGPTVMLPQVESGSPAALLLECAGDIGAVKTIPAILALVKRWMHMPRAKRAIETLVTDHKVFVMVPAIESLDALIAELAENGVKATSM